MKNLWNESDTAAQAKDPLTLRTYTSNLIGREEDLVVHGGGNTSVKVTEKNFFGDEEEILYVKGSGWDLATIKPQGFAPVKLDVLRRLATLTELSDTDMVREQKAAMTNPTAPSPSVEAILHALIPFQYVDHSHADGVVTLTNGLRDEAQLKKIFGERVLFVPYVMPGFVLARKVFELTQDLDWQAYDAMILMHHGIFTFADSARDSYNLMIEYVSKAESYLQEQGADQKIARQTPGVVSQAEALQFAQLRRQVSLQAGRPMVARLNQSQEAVGFSLRPDVKEVATRGPMTPDHVIHTKQIPVIFEGQAKEVTQKFAQDYSSYFAANNKQDLKCLDPAPRWGVWPGKGTIAIGKNRKFLTVIEDISAHTTKAIQWADALGGWWALPTQDIFDVEYWELEQAKLKKSGAGPEFEGKVALVTGAASGIGKACVEDLLNKGAMVVGLDINTAITSMIDSPQYLGLVCNAVSSAELKQAVKQAVLNFGGLDIVVSNAGVFPSSCRIEDMEDEFWEKSMAINLSSHEKLLNACIPYLKEGLEPAVVIVGSKNVPAPGPGAAAYSVAKAGLTQLARVAALELGSDGIRVNVVHPNAVFDTAIWTDDILSKRAKSYGLSVDEYKRNNVMKVEVTSKDVAHLVATMAGPTFAKTTAAQIPIDGGNDRVI